MTLTSEQHTNLILKTFLEGLYDEDCVLSKLRGCLHILKQIWNNVRRMGEILRIPVDILHISSPDKISVRVSHGNVLPKYYKLQRDIQQFCFCEKDQILKTIEPTEGICLVKHGRSYFRGLVLPSSAAPVSKYKYKNNSI